MLVDCSMHTLSDRKLNLDSTLTINAGFSSELVDSYFPFARKDVPFVFSTSYYLLTKTGLFSFLSHRWLLPVPIRFPHMCYKFLQSLYCIRFIEIQRVLDGVLHLTVSLAAYWLGWFTHNFIFFTYVLSRYHLGHSRIFQQTLESRYLYLSNNSIVV